LRGIAEENAREEDQIPNRQILKEGVTKVKMAIIDFIGIFEVF
jgi:hypothetical protein